MRILILSFYYPPDLSAGSFRVQALVRSLLEKSSENLQIDVITTLPNRYSSFASDAPEIEQLQQLTIRRIKLPAHKSGMLDQTRAFATFAWQAYRYSRKPGYDLVYGTSSRLMTAALSAFIAQTKRLPLYLDIRDIFVDTMNDILPKKVSLMIKPFLSLLEHWTFSRASKINLVSEGFKKYFEDYYPDKLYSYFTNGIDSEFIQAGKCVVRGGSRLQPVTVLYAGNMGEGQGLHAVIPELAKRFEGRAVFRLIGDGGARVLLQSRLQELACNNVELVSPVERVKLLEEYRKADVLFLHLNDYQAFRKVLPSKLFEYAAIGKPIWAGVAGYAAKFIEREIENAAVFYPCNITEAEQVFDSLDMESIPREAFLEKYSRVKIMSGMVSDVLALLETRK